MEIITGYTGKKHITSSQDRDINQGIIGPDSYVLITGMQLAAEVSSNNEIKIRDGVLMHQGCAASIKKNTYDSLTIINGSQGMKRIDLIVARYEKNQDNGIESLELKVIQGVPAETDPMVPEYTVGDIQAGDYVADMPLYKVIIDGLNITEVKKVFEIVVSNKDLTNKVTELESKISTKASIFGNIRKMYSGSAVITAQNKTSCPIFSNADINRMLGIKNSSNANTAVLVSNGDGGAQSAHVEGCTHLNGVWNVVFNQNVTGATRINYLIVVFNL